jgi:Flp pilus assembly pilin Flp
VEYGLLLAAVAAVVTAIVFALGVEVHGLFQTSTDCFAAGQASTC